MADGIDQFRTGGGIELANSLGGAMPEGLLGREVGGYRLDALLGQGGMGVVYRAVRNDGEIERAVALKLVASGLAVTRFQREKQIHAALNHPNIARLYDAGTTDEGLPFIIMELVSGTPVNVYCQERALGLRDRLRLLIQVVEAVAFAHANLIVHRDIKPSNVLVDGEGSPKLLDFGIAKSVDQEDGGLTGTTTPLTPNYASPEQLLAQPVSTASDIYQLGGLIAQVCGGGPPFTDTSLAGALKRAEADRVQLDPDVQQTLPSDLLAIVRKCLQPRIEDRYHNASEVAVELKRFLDGFPVQAKNPSLSMHASKFVRRHPLAFLAALTVAVVGLAGNYWYTDQLAQSRDRAEAASQEAIYQGDQARMEAQVSQEVTNFLIDLFKNSDPLAGNDVDITARELLERGTASIGSLPVQPGVRAQILMAMGAVYTNLGLYAESSRLLTEAKSLLADTHADARKITLNINLADAMWRQGEYDTAELLLTESEGWLQLLPGSNHELRGDLEMSRGTLEWSRAQPTEAAKHLEIALEERRKAYGEAHHKTAEVASNLGNIYVELRRFGEAEAALALSLAVQRDLYGDDHYSTAVVLAGIAGLHFDRMNFETGLPYMSDAIEVFERVLEADHPALATARSSLGRAHYGLGEHKQALVLLQRARDSRARSLGEEHLFTATTDGYMALVLAELDRGREATVLIDRAMAVYRSTLGENHPAIGEMMIYKAKILKSIDSVDRADQLYEAGKVLITDAVGENDPGIQRLVEIYEGGP